MFRNGKVPGRQAGGPVRVLPPNTSMHIAGAFKLKDRQDQRQALGSQRCSGFAVARLAGLSPQSPQLDQRALQ